MSASPFGYYDCHWWQVPSAFAWRSYYELRCFITTAHAPEPNTTIFMDGNVFKPCGCEKWWYEPESSTDKKEG